MVWACAKERVDTLPSRRNEDDHMQRAGVTQGEMQACFFLLVMFLLILQQAPMLDDETCETTDVLRRPGYWQPLV